MENLNTKELFLEIIEKKFIERIVNWNILCGNTKETFSKHLEISMITSERAESILGSYEENFLEVVDGVIDMLVIFTGTMFKLGFSSQDIENSLKEKVKTHELNILGDNYYFNKYIILLDKVNTKDINYLNEILSIGSLLIISSFRDLLDYGKSIKNIGLFEEKIIYSIKEILASNDSKFFKDENGKLYVKKDTGGKILKNTEGFFKPNLEKIFI